MPWTVADVEDHVKGLTDKQKQRWVAVANSVLAQCLEDGGTDETCAPKAIKQASGVVKEAEGGEMPTYETWIEEQGADVREMLDAHTQGLRSALQKEREARKAAERRDVDLAGDFVPLVEKSIRLDGTAPVKLIQPGWGTSGYYGPGLLERDGPKVFAQGTKMYWNHPTATEERERPERSLRDLAAELAGPAEWRADGPTGPGLYADAHVFGPFRDAVNELAPHIGVSIRAMGKANKGQAEGREGNIIEEIVSAQSVDFVTEPGAGGRVLQLFESARRDVAPEPQEVKVNEQEAQALRDANAQLTTELEAAKAEAQRLNEALLLREARDFVASTLGAIEMPAMTRERLVEALAGKPVVVDGALDKDAYKVAIETAASGEIAYLAKIVGSGAIKGMGGETPPTGVNLIETYKTYYLQQGRSLAEAEKLAALAATGGK